MQLLEVLNATIGLLGSRNLPQGDAQRVQSPTERPLHRRLVLPRRKHRPHPDRSWQAGCLQPW